MKIAITAFLLTERNVEIYHLKKSQEKVKNRSQKFVARSYKIQ